VNIRPFLLNHELGAKQLDVSSAGAFGEPRERQSQTSFLPEGGVFIRYVTHVSALGTTNVTPVDIFSRE